MRKHLLSALALVSMAVGHAQAQDPQLSQYYSAPLYLNPAFTGNLDYECRRLPESRYRIIGNYRNQAAGNFVTTMGSFDYRNKEGNWGIGFLAMQDKQGLVPLTTTQFSALASYKISLSNSWRMHSGLQAGYGQQGVDFDKLSFPDQFNSAGLVRGSNETITQRGSNFNFVDVSAGILVFDENFYIGSAVHHLNQPKTTFLSSDQRLAMKVSIHTGYRIPFTKVMGFAKKGSDRSITPTIHYKRQGNAQQLEVGSYFNYEPIIVGAWFRGVPIEKAPDKSLQRDAAVLLVGFRQATDYGLFKLGLSYDFPISQNTAAAGRTFEVSLSYQIINERCRKRVTYKSIPCPGI